MARNQKMVAAKELRERGQADLESLLKSKKEDLQKALFKHGLGQLRESHTLKHLRRDIARVVTVLSEQAAKDKTTGTTQRKEGDA